jgi:ABC-type polysaccharide/polyol phosphate export permease
MRSIIFGGVVDPNSLLQSASFSLLLMMIGLALFQGVERSFADTI